MIEEYDTSLDFICMYKHKCKTKYIVHELSVIQVLAYVEHENKLCMRTFSSGSSCFPVQFVLLMLNFHYRVLSMSKKTLEFFFLELHDRWRHDGVRNYQSDP